MQPNYCRESIGALCGQILIAVLVSVLSVFSAHASDDAVSTKTLNGYVAFGTRTSANYTGGASLKTMPAPLLQLEYKEVFYVFLDRVGVRFWGSEDKKMALGIAAEPRWGFHATDGPRLHDMATRHDRIEGGPSFEWETPAVSFSLAYFTDWTGAGGGYSWRLYLLRQLVDNPRWDIDVYAGLQKDSAKTVQYYFGVRSDESTVDRPFYQPPTSLNTRAGVNCAYKFGNGYAVLLGADTLVLGAAAADSPIVERKHDLTIYLGLGAAF